MALRGAPKEFLADQGSQTVACSKEISGVLELIDWNMVDGWCQALHQMEICATTGSTHERSHRVVDLINKAYL